MLKRKHSKAGHERTEFDDPEDFQQVDLSKNKTLIALPSNVGPRTMPNYPALFQQAINDLGNGITVFAGTVEDPFYIDLAPHSIP